MYLPLKYAEELKQVGIREWLSALGIDHLLPEYTNQDIIDCATDQNFLTPAYRGKFERLNRFAVSSDGLHQSLGNAWREEMIDVMSMTALVQRWSKAKAVYKFDRDFAVDLSLTNGLKLYPDVLSRLPYNTFYIDIDGIHELAPFTGIFVNVNVTPANDIYILAHRTIGMDYHTSYVFLTEKHRREENGVAYYDIGRDAIAPGPKIIYMSPLAQGFKKGRKHDISASAYIWMLVFQALAYLASDKPDVYVSPETKAAKRQAKQNGKKSNEPTKMEVGFRYGAAVRKEREAAARVVYEGGESVAHKSPRPHARCAHWHHYWTGEGRKILIVKWVSQTFVGAGEEKQAVVHKVRGKRKT